MSRLLTEQLQLAEHEPNVDHLDVGGFWKVFGHSDEHCCQNLVFRKCPNYGQAVWPGMGSQKTMPVGLEGVLEELIFEIL